MLPEDIVHGTLRRMPGGSAIILPVNFRLRHLRIHLRIHMRTWRGPSRV